MTATDAAYVAWLRRQPVDDRWEAWREEGRRRGWWAPGADPEVRTSTDESVQKVDER